MVLCLTGTQREKTSKHKYTDMSSDYSKNYLKVIRDFNMFVNRYIYTEDIYKY